MHVEVHPDIVLLCLRRGRVGGRAWLWVPVSLNPTAEMLNSCDDLGEPLTAYLSLSSVLLLGPLLPTFKRN